MLHRRRLLLALTLLLLLGGLALVPSVRWPVYGWLRGEAFYDEMPSNWWAAEIRANYRPRSLTVVLDGTSDGWTFTLPTEWHRARPLSLAEQLQQHLGTGQKPVCINAASADAWTTVPLVDGDAAALRVLLDLLRNNDAKVRWAAVSGLAALKPTPPVAASVVSSVSLHGVDRPRSLSSRADSPGSTRLAPGGTSSRP